MELMSAPERSPEPPAEPVREPAPGVKRTASRGSISSYGDDRLCDVEGCETKLSRYNAGWLCWVHSSDGPSGSATAT
jgi:hypothetical protein